MFEQCINNSATPKFILCVYMHSFLDISIMSFQYHIVYLMSIQNNHVFGNWHFCMVINVIQIDFYVFDLRISRIAWINSNFSQFNFTYLNNFLMAQWCAKRLRDLWRKLEEEVLSSISYTVVRTSLFWFTWQPRSFNQL